MHINTAVKEYLVEIEVRKFTKKTIRSYRNNLNIFLRYFQEEAQLTNIEVLSLAVVREFTLYLVEKGRKGSYINSLLKVVKAFTQYCYDEGYPAMSACGKQPIFKLEILASQQRKKLVIPHMRNAKKYMIGSAPRHLKN